MIQRIQTPFLALAALLNIGFVFTPLFEKVQADPALWITILVAATLGIASLLSLYSIFLYNNRKTQMTWLKHNLGAQVAGVGSSLGAFFSLGGIGTYLWDEALSLGVIMIAMLLQYFALRFVKKDDELVRSMDRIR